MRLREAKAAVVFFVVSFMIILLLRRFAGGQGDGLEAFRGADFNTELRLAGNESAGRRDSRQRDSKDDEYVNGALHYFLFVILSAGQA